MVSGSLVGGGNAILLLLTAMGVGGALIIAFVAARRHNRRVARTFAGGAALLGLAYTGGVIAASAASTEKTLAAGDTKWFCGFYLDCHLGLSIERTETTTSLAGPRGPVTPKGAFHIVTLRLHNSAKNPNLDMLLYRPDARIVDAAGRKYDRSPEGEAALATDRPPVLGAETSVGHKPVEATIVFDLPANVQDPRLMVSEGWIAARVIELGLINDENSIFHKRTLMALDGASERTASAEAQ